MNSSSQSRRKGVPGAGRNGIVVRPAIERLTAKLVVAPDTGCAEFTGALDRKGYARISNGARRSVPAHRVAYEAARGPIPSGLVIDHLCRNRRCCNPDHLEAVTVAENTRRGFAARPKSLTCPHGHLWEPDNIVPRADGYRDCRACRNKRAAQSYAKLNHQRQPLGADQ